MQTKKIFNSVFYALIFLNIFFLSSILSYRVISKGERIKLPDLVGKTLEEAKTELAKKKLSVAQQDVQFSSRWEKGKIIYQDPSPGSRIKVNKVVKVILSAGSEKVIVPQLIGENLQSVGTALRDAGLDRGKTSQVHTSKYAAGRVIAQFPLASEEVGRDSSVSILVSQGEEEKKYLMPDLLGKRADFVRAKLKEMGFNVGDVRYAYYPRLESGIVIKQFPRHGYLIQKRNLITLEVSK
jgi:beta-lactam-binding protein with PASTA domain